MLTLKEYNSFDKIKMIWDNLYKSNTDLSFYQSTDYVEVSWNRIFKYCMILRIVPKFYVLYDNNLPIMIIPLFKKWFKKEYCLYGYKAGFGYLDCISSDSVDLVTFSECIDLLYKYLDSKQIDFFYVRENTLLGKWIRRNKLEYNITEYTVITLPENYDLYYSSLSKHARQNIRTAYNRLRNENYCIEFDVIEYKNISRGLKDKLLGIYLDRQKYHYKRSGGWLYSLLVKYVDLCTDLQDSNNINIAACILYINGDVASYCDVIISDKGVLVPRLAINEQYNKFSPGILLVNEIVKEFIRRGINILDLTHGTEKYKLSMGGEIRNCISYNARA